MMEHLPVLSIMSFDLNVIEHISSGTKPVLLFVIVLHRYHSHYKQYLSPIIIGEKSRMMNKIKISVSVCEVSMVPASLKKFRSLNMDQMRKLQPTMDTHTMSNSSIVDVNAVSIFRTFTSSPTPGLELYEVASQSQSDRPTLMMTQSRSGTGITGQSPPPRPASNVYSLSSNININSRFTDVIGHVGIHMNQIPISKAEKQLIQFQNMSTSNANGEVESDNDDNDNDDDITKGASAGVSRFEPIAEENVAVTNNGGIDGNMNDFEIANFNFNDVKLRSRIYSEGMQRERNETVVADKKNSKDFDVNEGRNSIVNVTMKGDAVNTNDIQIGDDDEFDASVDLDDQIDVILSDKQKTTESPL